MKRKASKGQVAMSGLELMLGKEMVEAFSKRYDNTYAPQADTSPTTKKVAECQSPEALNSGEIGASGVKL